MRLQTLEEWLEGWEAAVESGQSRISKEEAIRRYYERYPGVRKYRIDFKKWEEAIRRYYERYPEER